MTVARLLEINLRKQTLFLAYLSERTDEGENAHQRFNHQQEEEVEVDHTGDTFRRGGVDLLHTAAHQSIDFLKSIENVHRGEEFARGYAEITAKYMQKWQEKLDAPI